MSPHHAYISSSDPLVTAADPPLLLSAHTTNSSAALFLFLPVAKHRHLSRGRGRPGFLVEAGSVGAAGAVVRARVLLHVCHDLVREHLPCLCHGRVFFFYQRKAQVFPFSSLQGGVFFFAAVTLNIRQDSKRGCVFGCPSSLSDSCVLSAVQLFVSELRAFHLPGRRGRIRVPCARSGSAPSATGAATRTPPAAA